MSLLCGLTFSCSTQIVNDLIGQGHLLAAGVADVPGCLKRIMQNSYVKAAFSSLSAFFSPRDLVKARCSCRCKNKSIKAHVEFTPIKPALNAVAAHKI